MKKVTISKHCSFCYFIEVDQDSGFTSIPAGFYWVVVTMTTVGGKHFFGVIWLFEYFVSTLIP